MNIETIKSKIQEEIKGLNKGIARQGIETPHLSIVMESKIQAYEKVLKWIDEEKWKH